MELIIVLYYNGKFLTSFTNVRLGWKCLAVTNSLAYYSKKLITTVKKFDYNVRRFKKNNLTRVKVTDTLAYYCTQ